jgi:hypothetical protein
VDRDVFQEHHFSSSVALQVVSENVPSASNEALATSPLPSSSRSDLESQTPELTSKAVANSYLSIPISEISPLPKAVTSVTKARKVQGTQKAVVLTSSPYVSVAEEARGKEILVQNPT